MKKGQIPGKIDEFAYVLLAGIILIAILMIAWTTPPSVAPTFLNITPKSVNIKVQLNTSYDFFLDFNGTATNVTLSATGELLPWISFSKRHFDIDRKETIKVTVSVPPAASKRTYQGNIIATYDREKITIPLSIQVTALPVENYRMFTFGSFLISSDAAETLDSKAAVEVFKGYFTGKHVTLLGSLSAGKLAKISGGNIRLIIDDTNYAGNLIVTFNKQVIYNDRANPGEVVIPINKSLIKSSNSVVISAGSPGWKFWMATSYKMRSASFEVTFPTMIKDFTFDLKPHEVTNFRYAKVTFSAKDYKLPLSNLKILINGQIVYLKAPPLAFFRDTFEGDIFGDKLILNAGANTLSFAFEKQGYYEIEDLVLVIAYS